MLKEFKQFALKGNMVDLEVGIIIGGAFNALVKSLVDDLIMPLLSLLTGSIDLTNKFIALNGDVYETLAAAKAEEVATVNYGLFISGIINFVIMAFVVFIIVKWINKLRKPEPIAEPTTKKCPHCLSDVNIKAVKCPFCTSDIKDEISDTVLE